MKVSKDTTHKLNGGKNGIALGAGAGMIFGAAFGSPAAGLVLGACLGLVLDAVSGRSEKE